MRTITTILSFTLLLQTIVVSGQTGSKNDKLHLDEIRSIFQQALDLPELQLYLHAGTDPRRQQVYVQEFGLINQENLKGVIKSGMQVKVMSELHLKRVDSENIFVVGDWTHVSNFLRLQLIYELEGVKVTYTFKKKNGEWGIDDYTLVEE